MSRRLVAALACRNNGSRLYAKPLQNLDLGVTVLSQILSCLKKIDVIDAIVLGIADGIENKIYEDIAEEENIGYIFGDEINVLSRLIKCGEKGQATDILRVTTESPFPYCEMIQSNWEKHCYNENDATFLENIIDGCYFEIIKLEALKESNKEGIKKHRSEMCSLYIRENPQKFKVHKSTPPVDLIRKDLRFTVDYPEDIVVCRAIYKKFKNKAPFIPLNDAVKFMDENPQLKELILPYCEAGYDTMYI